jgi:PAS domain S-box-containing protein
MRPETGPSKIDSVGDSTWASLEHSNVLAVVLTSSSGRILAANVKFAELMSSSAPALCGRSIDELLVGREDRLRWQKVLQEGATTGLEFTFTAADDHLRTLRGDLHRVNAAPGRTILRGVFVDISEELQMRQAMQRGARLEALGSLTSGVAHDFNNLLTVLVGNLSLAAEEVRAQPALFSKLKSARDAARRGADLIRQLLAFASRESVEADVVNPVRVVEDLIGLLQRALGARIKLTTELESGAGPVMGSVATLESAIVNLAINARDAVGATGGRVTLSVRNTQLLGPEAQARGLAAGQYVTISVVDDGEGIAPEILDHVFEPFFSTKRASGGTGLGLSMVRAFAQQAEGTAIINSKVGQGTKVSIVLPRCMDKVEETSARTMPLSTLPTGDEQVLVLSTEDGLRSTVRQILEVLGYQVALVADRAELAAALRRGSAQLLIIDGAQNGDISKITAALPSTMKTVMLTTGADDSANTADTCSAILHKPFSLADLAGLVRQTLDGPY